MLAVIGSHLGATLELMVAATLIAVLLGTWIGIMGAIRRYSFFDYLATIGAMVALSIPTFWFGLDHHLLFSVELGWLPAGNRYTVGDGSFLDYLHHLIGPSLVLALVTIAIWSRYMRSSMLDVINQDYIRTARAKGLPERVVLVHHAIRNALLPMITLAGLQLPTLLGGALVTETVFTWPGMGRLFLNSLGYRDYPVVMGILDVLGHARAGRQPARRPALRRRRSAHPAGLIMTELLHHSERRSPRRRAACPGPAAVPSPLPPSSAGGVRRGHDPVPASWPRQSGPR